MRIFSGFATLALILSLAVGMLFWARTAQSPEGLRTASIGGETFVYPARFARDAATALGGVADRLAFVAAFPDFEPPVAEQTTEGQHLRPALELVLITVSAKDDGLDPSERPSRLYARFLEGSASAGPDGLVIRRFEAGSPYDLEQLYVAPPDGRSFFARCPNDASVDAAATGDFCLFLFRDGAVDVEMRFSPALLSHWEALAAGGRAFLARLRASDGRAVAPPSVR